jgi:hypothetical protein
LFGLSLITCRRIGSLKRVTIQRVRRCTRTPFSFWQSKSCLADFRPAKNDGHVITSRENLSSSSPSPLDQPPQYNLTKGVKFMRFLCHVQRNTSRENGSVHF